MRRDFLKLCSLAGLGFSCPGGLTSLLRADTKEEPPYEGPFYVVFNASGGWDTTYLMDPKGRFVAPIRADEPGDAMAADLLKHLS